MFDAVRTGRERSSESTQERVLWVINPRLLRQANGRFASKQKAVRILVYALSGIFHENIGVSENIMYPRPSHQTKGGLG